MNDELITYRDPKSPISEVFKTLRTNIQFMDSSKRSKVFVITSSSASEGKSWISANLAVSFAQANKKVLLIDGDMRKGRQYKIFGITPKPGLSNYLSGINNEDDRIVIRRVKDYINREELDNLFLIPAGNIPPNPSELLNSEEMRNLIEEARNNFDIIIIDGTPVQLVSDSLVLARMADGFIVVAAANETKKEELKRVLTNINNVGGKILGVILNKIPVSSKAYEKKYYYSARSSREKIEEDRSEYRNTIDINIDE